MVTGKLLSIVKNTHHYCCCYLLAPGSSHGAWSSPPPKRVQLICIALLSLAVLSLKQTHTSHSVYMHLSMDGQARQWPTLISSNTSHSGVLSCTFLQAWSEINAFSCTGWVGADWLEYELQLFSRTTSTPCCMSSLRPLCMVNTITQAQVEGPMQHWRTNEIP